MVMAEIPMALFTLAALIGMVRFLERETTGRAVAVGLLISAAILTKPSAWAVPLSLPLALLLLKQPRRLLSPRAWMAGAIVAAICVPYYALTLRMMRAGLEGRSITWERAWHAFATYMTEVPAGLGIALTILMVAGMAGRFLLPLRAGRLTPFWAVLAGFLISALLFHIVTPTSAESRKAYIAAPGLVIFAAAGARWLAGDRRTRVIAAAAVVVFLVVDFRVPPRQSTLAPGVASFLTSRQDLAETAFLVCSEWSGGEGAVIAGVASLDNRRPRHYVLRSSKLLASVRWNGVDYKARYASAAQVRTVLDSIPVNALILQSSGSSNLSEHQRLLERVLEDYPADWEPIYSAKSPDGREAARIYRRTTDVRGRPIRFEVDLEDKIGEKLKSGN